MKRRRESQNEARQSKRKEQVEKELFFVFDIEKVKYGSMKGKNNNPKSWDKQATGDYIVLKLISARSTGSRSICLVIYGFKNYCYRIIEQEYYLRLQSEQRSVISKDVIIDHVLKDIREACGMGAGAVVREKSEIITRFRLKGYSETKSMVLRVVFSDESVREELWRQKREHDNTENKEPGVFKYSGLYDSLVELDKDCAKRFSTDTKVRIGSWIRISLADLIEYFEANPKAKEATSWHHSSNIERTGASYFDQEIVVSSDMFSSSVEVAENEEMQELDHELPNLSVGSFAVLTDSCFRDDAEDYPVPYPHSDKLYRDENTTKTRTESPIRSIVCFSQQIELSPDQNRALGNTLSRDCLVLRWDHASNHRYEDESLISGQKCGVSVFGTESDMIKFFLEWISSQIDILMGWKVFHEYHHNSIGYVICRMRELKIHRFGAGKIRAVWHDTKRVFNGLIKPHTLPFTTLSNCSPFSMVPVIDLFDYDKKQNKHRVASTLEELCSDLPVIDPKIFYEDDCSEDGEENETGGHADSSLSQNQLRTTRKAISLCQAMISLSVQREIAKEAVLSSYVRHVKIQEVFSRGNSYSANNTLFYKCSNNRAGRSGEPVPYIVAETDGFKEFMEENSLRSNVYRGGLIYNVSNSLRIGTVLVLDCKDNYPRIYIDRGFCHSNIQPLPYTSVSFPSFNSNSDDMVCVEHERQLYVKYVKSGRLLVPEIMDDTIRMKNNEKERIAKLEKSLSEERENSSVLEDMIRTSKTRLRTIKEHGLTFYGSNGVEFGDSSNNILSTSVAEEGRNKLDNLRRFIENHVGFDRDFNQIVFVESGESLEHELVKWVPVIIGGHTDSMFIGFEDRRDREKTLTNNTYEEVKKIGEQLCYGCDIYMHHSCRVSEELINACAEIAACSEKGGESNDNSDPLRDPSVINRVGIERSGDVVFFNTKSSYILYSHENRKFTHKGMPYDSALSPPIISHLLKSLMEKIIGSACLTKDEQESRKCVLSICRMIMSACDCIRDIQRQGWAILSEDIDSCLYKKGRLVGIRDLVMKSKYKSYIETVNTDKEKRERSKDDLEILEEPNRSAEIDNHDIASQNRRTPGRAASSTRKALFEPEYIHSEEEENGSKEERDRPSLTDFPYENDKSSHYHERFCKAIQSLHLNRPDLEVKCPGETVMVLYVNCSPDRRELREDEKEKFFREYSSGIGKKMRCIEEYVSKNSFKKMLVSLSFARRNDKAVEEESKEIVERMTSQKEQIDAQYYLSMIGEQSLRLIAKTEWNHSLMCKTFELMQSRMVFATNPLID